MSILEIRGLSKAYGAMRVLDELTSDIEEGSVVGIVGRNGAGKSTLLQVLSGVQPADAGEVRVRGKALPRGRHRALESGIARTFQDGRVFGSMTVLENMLVALPERRSRKWFRGGHDTKRAREGLKRVGLLVKEDALASGLSFGQRKLLEIARSLITGAEIFLFDEPFSGLSPEVKEDVARLIKELKAEKKTVVVVEHELTLLHPLCDRILVMQDGALRDSSSIPEGQAP